MKIAVVGIGVAGAYLMNQLSDNHDIHVVGFERMKEEEHDKVLQITKLFEKESFLEKYSPSNICDKIKEDMPKLERYIRDDKYREKLRNSFYPYNNPELFDIRITKVNKRKNRNSRKCYYKI